MLILFATKLTGVSSSPGFLHCIDLFDMVLGFLSERKWLKENIERFMMLMNEGRDSSHHG